MDPPATPSHREFLKPQGPARPRGQASSSSAHAESSSTQSSAPGSPSSSAVDEIQGSASNYERQDPNADFVYYKKPPITPFEMDPSQPTQLLPDIEGLELSEGNGPFACLHGHGATMDADLIRDKTRYIVGTSEACDIRISHGSWLGLGLNPRVMNEPWFKLYAEPSISVPGEMKVYIEDISTTGVYVNGKKMAKSERILLQYGDVIKGGLDGSGLELFHYSFKKCINNSDAVRVIRGDLSTYRREEESFGQGNYAKVYKAIDEADQTLYACKAFDRHSRVYNDHEMAGIEFEITLLRDLRHENIVMFRDSCQIGAVTYLILEYVDGVTLFKYYTKVNNYFAEHEARTIFRQACNGVNYLHTQGIVHRDIKCENIMVVKTPDDKIKVKLIDFGLARRSTTERVLTTFCGTDPYMAPETAVGEESNGYGKAVDVWGLGVVLFRMLTGEYPFQPRRSEQVGNATAGKTQVESTLVEETAADPGASRQDPEITYSAGYRAFYKDDWRPRLNKLAPRSTEVKLLLDEMLEIDASKRCLIHRVFRFDWMRMATRELAKFDLSKESRKAADQETTESSHISLETSETSQPTTPRKTWGVLTIVPGSIADAPRRIELWKDKTKLGRDPRLVDVVLGSDRQLSSYQCMIHRRQEDGMIMVMDLSYNGTYINKMRIGAQKACQLFPGDHIGIIIPQDDESALKDLAGDQVKRFLKYKVEIIGMPDATKDEVVRRKYFQCDVETGLPTRQRERSPPPSDTNAVWAILREFTTEGRETNKKYQLRLKKTRFGRDRCCEVIINHTYVSREHCLFDWEPEERKAYLINRSTNGTFVNGEPCSGRFQLRDKDEIQLVKPSGIAEQDKKKEATILRIEFVPMDESAPPAKRHKE